jgi:hypothetical protein
MKTIDVSRNAASLAEAVTGLGREPTAVLKDGRPVAVLLPVEGADLETLSLSLNAQFLAILEKSKQRHLAEGGVSGDEMRRRLGAEAPSASRAKGNGRKAKTKRSSAAPPQPT